VSSLRAIIDLPLQGMRLDSALTTLFSDHSRSAIARFILDGRVSVNSAIVTKTSHRIATGDEVALDIPPAAASSLPSQDIPLTILYQDADLIVIDKPPGLVVHPAAGHPDQTLVNALLFHVDDLSGIGGELRPGIVHRLDKDTSGVMIIAKHDDAHRKLTRAWNTDQVRKEYVALVYGKPHEAHGTIDVPIGRDPNNRKRMAVVSAGRKAVTDYEVTEQYRYASLLRCRIRTGRTHQIRVHLKSLGHPIIGDPVYSGPQWRGIPDKKLQKVLADFKRQALHASRISIPHPSTGEMMRFDAPMPADMVAVVDVLRGAG
jgi:23S rRNA pseudouridine1911/1915/1917 synthase